MSGPLVLITGGGGYLGRVLARRYLDSSDLGVVLLLRAGDGGDAGGPAAARAALEAHFGSEGRRVRYVAGDLTAVAPFAALDEGVQRRITQVVHAAAVTRFDVERGLATRVNVEGTDKVLAFARRCPRLESVGHISTVYSSGLREGRIAEQPCDGQAGFANAYEWSKAKAERLLVERYGDLPWRILRVATVVADDDSGAVTQHNAVHETLKLWFYGMLPLLPGRADTPLYFVTAAFGGDAVVQLMAPQRPGGVYHVAHGCGDSLTLDGLLTVAAAEFGQVEDFRRRRILRPLLADRESFELLVDGVTSFGGSFVTQALRNVAPFARQLYVRKDLDNSRLRAAMGGYRAPDAADLVRRTCRQLVATRWGKRVGVA
ncbi:MAG TPA: SDR family oxidoreductase [Egibacteraceae bacterium]|nr:SDR family oxidoreductase [Egibacteraceae bacterium]